ncbi:MAG: N-acetylmuramoyl-L-alanine amidase [Oscillospiraceae bacterium]|nr:N-acetylmuramoyl-L-alanine amidase [Oscillospiraceae bacterium]
MKNVKQGHIVPVVCLDAGHCAKQNRSGVVPEFYESEINWKLHNLLTEQLKKYGIQVVKTRADQNKDLELTARGKMARNCDLFLSMHVNAADNSLANYALGVHMVDDNCGLIDVQSKEIAKLLSDCVAQILGVKAEVWTRKSASDRDGNGYKDDYYGVLRGAHCVGTAGVIIEHGFYTNKAQAKFLLKDSNLAAIAEAEAKVIADWFEVEKTMQEDVVIGNPYKLELVSIRRGSRGAQVEALQALLIAKGYSCGSSGIDGSFGPQTEEALKAYQENHGLTADGFAGPQTMSSLLGYR